MKPSRHVQTFSFRCPFGDDECKATLDVVVTPYRRGNYTDPPEPAELEARGCHHVEDVNGHIWAVRVAPRLWEMVQEEMDGSRDAEWDRRLEEARSTP